MRNALKLKQVLHPGPFGGAKLKWLSRGENSSSEAKEGKLSESPMPLQRHKEGDTPLDLQMSVGAH